MRYRFFFACLLGFYSSPAQDTSSYTPARPVWVFASPKLINARTVELVPKGTLEFSVTHNFGDIGGTLGGAKTFFGLDNATDVRIGFQYGLSDRINLIAARAKGASLVQQLYETGLAWRIMQQATGNKKPFSLTLFANNVISGMKAAANPEQDNSFGNFSDRLSQAVQLMIARRMGKVSLQLSPTWVHRNYVVTGDENNLFALGAAIRLPVKGRFNLIADYFHTFRSRESIDFYKSQGIRFYGALGVGAELVTEGHVFHLNFTNATEILENRFIPRTITNWGDGQFRWGFTITREFRFRKKERN